MYIGKALVVYCDGGNFRKNPGPSGCGLYWYLYNNENPNKFPMTNIVATSKGLMDKKNTKLVEFPTINTKEEFIEVVKEKVYYNVNVLSMHEYAKGFNGEASNNLAEVRGLTKALEVMLNEKPDYRVGKADVITGIDNTQVTIKESHLSVENVRPNIGTGMYDVGNEIARMTLGVDNCVIYSTNPTNVKFDTNLPTKLKELVIEGKQIILVIMLSDNSVAITDIELPVELVELMSNTNRITVYACYQMN